MHEGLRVTGVLVAGSHECSEHGLSGYAEGLINFSFRQLVRLPYDLLGFTWSASLDPIYRGVVAVCARWFGLVGIELLLQHRNNRIEAK